MYKNDYELIYLYRTTKSEAIIDIIFQKYKPLIWKNIHKFYIPIKDQDDFFQEALMTLLECVQRFDESMNKTFTKYFELILYRKFISLKDKSAKYVLIEKVELFQESYTPVHQTVDIGNVYLSPLETEIKRMYFDERLTMESIAKSLNKEVKSIKNAIYRIKVKLK
jgi:RNA polymerase sporulation-specific sigma factor